MRSFFSKLKHSRITPVEIFLLIPFTVLIYSLMEWLFFISKPSFLSSSEPMQRFTALINSTAILSFLFMLILLPGSLIFYLIRSTQIRKFLRVIFCLLPAFIIASTILLFVDNFTYTLFKFGVVSTEKIPRFLYLIGLILLVFLLTIPVFHTAYSIERSRRKLSTRQKVLMPLTINVLILLFTFMPILFSTDQELDFPHKRIASEPPPNILLITADGINATNTSVYGSKDDTTPFLRDLVPYSMVARNAFSNAQGTVGSTTSMLTGKSPMDIRVLASTDILKDEDAYQHLPGILKSQGYYTLQLSFSYYADAYRLNILNGFDRANGESPITDSYMSKLSSAFPTDTYYLLREMYSRISDRLGHLLYIKTMTNPFIQVTESPVKFNDNEKLEYLFSVLDRWDQPIFVHLHWMGTHGPKYYPDKQVFSVGKDPKNQDKYETDFYLDSILEFDQAVSRIYTEMEEKALLDSTILLISSDHTQRWTIDRIPFLIRFPNGDHAGKIDGNVQNLDIAPTLLDYLDIDQPEWMSGDTLLEPIALDRPVFIDAIPESKRNPKTNKVVYPPQVPPYYQFGRETVIVCDHFYTINFFKMQVTDGTISSYDGVCPEKPITEEEAVNLVTNHMEEFGFSTDSLETILDEEQVPTQSPD